MEYDLTPTGTVFPCGVTLGIHPGGEGKGDGKGRKENSTELEVGGRT